MSINFRVAGLVCLFLAILFLLLLILSSGESTDLAYANHDKNYQFPNNSANKDVVQAPFEPLTTSATGPAFVMIELEDISAVELYVRNRKAQISAENLKLANQAYISKLEAIQQQFSSTLTGLGAKIIYRVQRVYNGLAVEVDSSKLEFIAGLPRVKALHPLLYRERLNASSVPQVGTPVAWNSYGTGANIKIGVIDSG